MKLSLLLLTCVGILLHSCQVPTQVPFDTNAATVREEGEIGGNLSFIVGNPTLLHFNVAYSPIQSGMVGFHHLTLSNNYRITGGTLGYYYGKLKLEDDSGLNETELFHVVNFSYFNSTNTTNDVESFFNESQFIIKANHFKVGYGMHLRHSVLSIDAILRLGYTDIYNVTVRHATSPVSIAELIKYDPLFTPEFSLKLGLGSDYLRFYAGFNFNVKNYKDYSYYERLNFKAGLNFQIDMKREYE